MLVFCFVIVPFKSVIADANWVPTGSMNPTILEGDFLYVDKLAYDLRLPLSLHSLQHRSDPQRGDIAVLLSPDKGTRVVKRVIGIPGDEIELRGNVVCLNGTPLEYDVLPDEAIAGMPDALKRKSVFAEETLDGNRYSVMALPGRKTPLRFMPKIVVPEGQYFVLGDNRDNSLDSRIYGFADRNRFLGQAKRVLMSFDILDRFQPRLERFGQELR